MGSVWWFVLLLGVVFTWELLPDTWRGGISASRAGPLLMAVFAALALFVYANLLP